MYLLGGAFIRLHYCTLQQTEEYQGGAQYDLPQLKNPCPEDNSIYNFCKLFLGHHYYTFNLSDVCLSEEKKILKEIMHSYSLTFMATTQHNNPCLGGHETE